MLENITRLFPALSLAIVAALSVFNIGYFWRFGVHYLGLIDLTNLVYSFGLFSLAVFGVVFFIPRIVRHLFEAYSTVSDLKRALRTIRILLWIATAIVFLAVVNPKSYLGEHFVQDGLVLLGLLVANIAFVSQSWLRYKILEKETASEVAVVVLLAVGTVFTAGLFIADVEAISGETYKVRTKQEEMENVRIIRSSSSGLILFTGGTTLFVPMSEVLSVRANRGPAQRF